MSTRIEQYEAHIAKIKAAPPDFEDLAEQWPKVMQGRFLSFIEDQYGALGLTETQKHEMAKKDVEAYRKTLSESQYQKQLEDLHKQGVDVLLKQLEFERDNPGKDYEQPKQEEPTTESVLVEAFVSWVGSRIGSNIEGAKRESGDLAKALRATLGISWKDIQKYGIFGGRNSFFRKPFG